MRVFHARIHVRGRRESGLAGAVFALILLAIFLPSMLGYQVHTNKAPAATASVDSQTEIDGSPLGPAHLCEVNFGPKAFGVDHAATPAKRAKDYAACMKAYKDGTFYARYGDLAWIGAVEGHGECTASNPDIGMTMYCSDGYIHKP